MKLEYYDKIQQLIKSWFDIEMQMRPMTEVDIIPMWAHITRTTDYSTLVDVSSATLIRLKLVYINIAYILGEKELTKLQKTTIHTLRKLNQYTNAKLAKKHPELCLIPLIQHIGVSNQLLFFNEE